MTHFITSALAYVDGAMRPETALEIDDDGRIAAVVPRAEIPAGAAVEDLGNVALLPGTVNAHGHAFQHMLRGYMDDTHWEDAIWQIMYPAAERLRAEDIYTVSKHAFAEAAKCGITTFVDFFYINDQGNDNARAVIRAAKSVGIRLVLARVFFDEGLGDKGAPARYQETPEVAYRNFLELAEEFADDPLVSVQPAPHSFEAASVESIRYALEAARKFDVPMHMHFHDHIPERQRAQREYGKTAVRVLHDEGLLTDRLILVHAEPMDEEEIALIAAAGASVVHCPNPTFKTMGRGAETTAMMHQGIKVGFGCDGGCINNRQSIFDEMRTGAFLERFRVPEEEALIDASVALDLGTKTNGQILRLDIGELKAGNWADCVAIDLEDLSVQPLSKLDKNIVYAMQPTAIRDVLVAGRPIVRERTLVGVDQSSFVAELNETIARVHGEK